MRSNRKFKVISFVLVVAYVLSACAGAPATASSSGGSKPLAQPVTYLGVIEDISGDQWTINGLTVTVTADVVRDGPFAVGDQVKVEAQVNPDGSLSISRIEAPSAGDLSTLPSLGNENNNANDANSNEDLNSNDDNTNTSNSNDNNSNDDANSNDDNSNDDDDNDSNSNDDDDDDNGNSGSNSNDDDDDNDNDNGSSGSNSNDGNDDNDNDDDDDDNDNDDD
jgi:hypothetical protein